MEIENDFIWLEKHLACRGPYGLHRIEFLMERLENPQFDTPSVLIGGTNGKGSVTMILESIATASGEYNIGSTISPHLINFRERIRIQGENLSEELWLEGIKQIKPHVKLMEREPSIGEPSFFELVIALFFWSLRETLRDLAFVEVGLGGKLDATNLIHPEISVITNIGTDHKEFLGPDKPSIAIEKLGIVRKKGTLITSEKDPQILEIFRKDCSEKKANLILSKPENYFSLLGSTPKNHLLKLPCATEPIRFSLPGMHQLENLGLALSVIDKLRMNGFQIPDNAIVEGIEKVKWPGRLHWIEGNPPILLDGAHNQEGLQSLIDYLQKFPLPRPVHLILGVLSNKPVVNMAKHLSNFADTLSFVPPNTSRAITEAEFNEQIKPLNPKWKWCPSLPMALEEGKNSATILLSGSLYLVADFLSIAPAEKPL
ncbi:MAG: hypothetical protein HQM08_25280 [Candidatus Riflebacteria bacterium]|nr:hypothetical protein [Candidatus Riflebacteria bacterium]